MIDMDVILRAYEAWNRRDVEALLAVSHPEIEIVPLVGAVTTSGPWHGHDGVRRLMADARESWDRFTIRPDDFVPAGDRVVALVHVETVARGASTVVEGDIAHLIEMRDGLAMSFVAYRDRIEALRAAGS